MRKIFLSLLCAAFTMSALAQDPQVGDEFSSTDEFGNELMYRITSIGPNKVILKQGGHTISYSELVIPASVGYIGQTFAVTDIEISPQLAGARSISLPNSLENDDIDWNYGQLDDLEEWIVADDNPLYRAVNGVLYSADTTLLVRCPAKKVPFVSADINPKATRMRTCAFYKCTGLGALEIPNTIVSISSSTFAGSSLTNVKIPKTITSIHDSSFGSCPNLTEIDFEDVSVVTVGWNSFNGSKILTDQTGDFKVIDSLAIKYTGTDEIVTLPDSIVNVAYSFIYYNDAAGANLTTVVLPASIKTVSHQFLSFNDNTEIFPNLEKIVCKAQDVPNVTSTHVEINSAKNVTLVVPCDKEEAYTLNAQWNPATPVFASIVEDCSTSIEEPSTFNNTHSTLHTQKVLRDGQLLLIRDGRTYNAQGVELR